MKKKKSFDCVNMKWDIQKKIETECAHLGDYQIHEKYSKKIQNNKILGPFCRNIIRLKKIEKEKSVPALSE